jgi:hypothetical protein
MVSYAYEIEEVDRDDYILEREDIETESDPDTLREWQRGLEDREDILTMQVEAFRLNPRDDRGSLLWFHRLCMAKAANGVGMTRLKRRMIALGMLEDPQACQITALNAKVLTLKAEIAALQERAAA